jgi:ribosomal protein S27E
MSDTEASSGARTKLLACPFCGNRAAEVTTYEKSVWNVECTYCTAEIHETTREATIFAWNRREGWAGN